MWKNRFIFFQGSSEEETAHWAVRLNESPASRSDRYIHSSMKPTALCQVSNYAQAEKNPSKALRKPERSFSMKSIS